MVFDGGCLPTGLTGRTKRVMRDGLKVEADTQAAQPDRDVQDLKSGCGNIGRGAARAERVHRTVYSPASRLNVVSKSAGKSRSQRASWWSIRPAAIPAA